MAEKVKRTKSVKKTRKIRRQTISTSVTFGERLFTSFVADIRYATDLYCKHKIDEIELLCEIRCTSQLMYSLLDKDVDQLMRDAAVRMYERALERTGFEKNKEKKAG